MISLCQGDSGAADIMKPPVPVQDVVLRKLFSGASVAGELLSGSPCANETLELLQM